MNARHALSASGHAEIVEHLQEAFSDLSNAGADTLKMAEAIGGARALVAIALSKLGEPGPMRTLDEAAKSFLESLSNSAAPLTNAAKESAPAAGPLGGGSGGCLHQLLDADSPEFESLFAAALVSRETC